MIDKEKEYLSQDQPYVPGQVIVKYKEDYVGARSLSHQVPLNELDSSDRSPGLGLAEIERHQTLRLSGDKDEREEMIDVLEELNTDPAVEFAQLNYIYELDFREDEMESEDEEGEEEDPQQEDEEEEASSSLIAEIPAPEDKDWSKLWGSDNTGQTINQVEGAIHLQAEQLQGHVGNENREVTVRVKKQAKRADELNEEGTNTASDVVDFTIEIGDGESNEEVRVFGRVLKRDITLNREVNADQSTVVRVEEDGSFTAVPTVFADGKATFYGFSNSEYVVIENGDKNFNDVASDHWAKDAVSKLAAKNIIAGMNDTTFAPSKSTTRAEFAALLTRSLGLATDDTNVDFTDVSEDAWFAEELAAAVHAGIIEGYNDNSFGPNDNVTREQAASMLSRALDHIDSEIEGDHVPMFSDSHNIAPWAEDEVQQLAEAGIIVGTPQGTFEPKEDIQRAAIAVMLEGFLTSVEWMDE